MTQQLETDYAGDAYRACLHGDADSNQQRSAAAQIILLQATKAELLEALKKTREFVDTVHDGEYGYSECTRDELVEKLDAIIAKHGA